MHPISNDLSIIYPPKSLPILLDGRIIGYIEVSTADELVESLRVLKVR